MDARIIISDSLNDSNMFYAVKTVINDDFIFIDKDGKKTIYVDPSWLNSAKQEAQVDRIVNYSDYDMNATRNSLETVIESIVKEQDIDRAVIPSNLKIKYARILEKSNVKIRIEERMFPERESKTKTEVQSVRMAQEATEKAMDKVVSLIRQASIGDGGRLVLNGRELTRFDLERAALIELLNNGCESPHGCMVFNSPDLFRENNKGYLFGGKPIIIDIFPRSSANRYYSDMTRTIAKGSVSDEAKKLYNAVMDAQKYAIEKVRPGLKANELYKAVLDYFHDRGYETDRGGIISQGFTHGLGHGVGLDVHEAPELNIQNNAVLKEGNVITIEPGLYYPEIGGVRIEDVLLITKDGCQNLTSYPKYLEV